MPFRVEAIDGGKFMGTLTFATQDEAKIYAADLIGRTVHPSAVHFHLIGRPRMPGTRPITDTRVVECEGAVTARWKSGLVLV
jgi:hypothetical protein